jgi:hypothetical protein
MRASRAQLSPKPHFSSEWRQALQLLARSKRGAMEDVLELAHGFSREMLGMLVLDGLATVVTETLMANGVTFKIERMQITDAGRFAIRG